MSFITSIGTAVPSHCFEQSTIRDFMIQVMKPGYEASRKLQTIFRSSGIQTRYSVLDDYGKTENFSFYPNSQNFEPFPSTYKRIQEYQKHALTISKKAIENCLKLNPKISTNALTHLITVSCTGMYAPGLDIDIVKSFNLPSNIQRTCINFMGCYAAFNAIKIADSICKASNVAKVLVVCTELCSLHFQKEPNDDNLLANALFADGSAAMVLENTPSGEWNLSPTIFHNALSFTDEQHMAWTVGNFGFEMKLSAYVPSIIKSGIKKLTVEMLETLNKSVDRIKHFAIHPGGKKILEVVEQELGITKSQNQAAYAVLSKYGNMSSATIVFVLQQILQKLNATDDHSDILSFAFGPGLTLESILFSVHKHA